jgi:hypothetical protein
VSDSLLEVEAVACGSGSYNDPLCREEENDASMKTNAPAGYTSTRGEWIEW